MNPAQFSALALALCFAHHRSAAITVPVCGPAWPSLKLRPVTLGEDDRQ
jgi:hypothetical protein